MKAFANLANPIAARDATQKIGRKPEGSGRGNHTMLKVAEKPTSGKANVAQFVGFSEDHRAAMWLDEEVKKARKGVTTQVVELTPALARVLMDRNPKNRKISDLVVESYTRDIEHGKWRFNGEALIIADDGTLNDGQHRCSAVIAADKPVMATLVIGVERDSRATLDQGRTRTVGDYLAMEGYVNTNQLGAAASFVFQHQARGYLAKGGSGKPTKSEVMALIDLNPSLVQSVAQVQVKGAAAYGGQSMLAFCHWTFWQASDRASADDFIRKLTEGAGLLARDPILYLRNRLVNERGRLRPNDKAELIFRAWNASRRGETPKNLPILGSVLPVLEQ